jgi:hypothetical protein
MPRNIYTKMKHIHAYIKQISNKLKLKVINCYIYSTLLYEAETWTLGLKAEKKIKALEMWIYQTN